MAGPEVNGPCDAPVGPTKNKKQLEKNLLVLWKKFHSNQLVGFSSENALWGLSCSPCNSLNLSCICIGQSNQLQF